MRASKSITLSLAVLVVLAACGDSKATDNSVALKPKVTIASTSDPQNKLLVEIYGQALEKASFRVVRKTAFDSADALYAAMESGSVQLTAVTAKDVFDWAESKASVTDPMPATTALQTDAISKILPATLKLGPASTAEDKDVIFCAKTFTDTNNLVTLSDLGTKPQTATLAAPDGFDTATPLGAAALKDAYEIQFKAVVPTESAKIIDAVTAGTADCGVGRSGDPALAAATFTVLEDDKAIVPNDVVLPLLTTDGASADVVAVVEATSTRLTSAQLRAMLQRLKDGTAPELIANDFAAAAGS